MDFFSKSNPLTIGVLVLLSTYFISIVWIFIYRYLYIFKWQQNENRSLESMLLGSQPIGRQSKLFACVNMNVSTTRELLGACKNNSMKDATVGLAFLSIASSTSPFIGLFGTVISILETFSSFGDQSRVTLNVIAPAISEALIATAAGIFVAIFAYTFYQMLKREIYKLDLALQTQIDLVISNQP